jgi:hypothetical protein
VAVPRSTTTVEIFFRIPVLLVASPASAATEVGPRRKALTRPRLENAAFAFTLDKSTINVDVGIEKRER